MPVDLAFYPNTNRLSFHRGSNMPFGNIFRRKSSVSINDDELQPSREPGLLRRLSRSSSKSEATKQTTTHRTSHSGQNLVPPSFPAPGPASTSTSTSTSRSSSRPRSSSSRMAGPSDTPPPTYTEAIKPETISTTDDPFAFLATFDTVFLIDDSGSMAGRSWNETSQALAAIAPICAAHDADGVDVYFLNNRSRPNHRNLRSAVEIHEVFTTTKPYGPTPTGTALNGILRPYLKDCETRGPDAVKPLNIIVITDGVPTDDPESVIIQAAKRLENMDAAPYQVGIQFFQVGNEPSAADALKQLDDGLVEEGCLRDIVDTIPWRGQLSANGMLKVVLGAVNRRLDRKRASGESSRA